MPVVEVQQTITELRKTQAAVARSLTETKEAVLWLQKLEVLEQQLTLVPRYREKAGSPLQVEQTEHVLKACLVSALERNYNM